MLNLENLPSEVRDKLAELDLELSEGDITQKGYEKKRNKLLAPYLNNTVTNAIDSLSISNNNATFNSSNNHSPDDQVKFTKQNQLQNINNYGVYAQANSNNNINNKQNVLTSNVASPQTRAKLKVHRRVTRHESRYHSEIRQEAVQQALAAMQNKPKQALPMPSKRSSVLTNHSKKSKDKNKINSRHRRKQLQNRNFHHVMSASSGHGTTGESESSTDDDYDDDDYDDEDGVYSDNVILNEVLDKDLNISKKSKHKIDLSSSDPSSPNSSPNEKLLPNNLLKQQQPLPLPPRNQESNHYRSGCIENSKHGKNNHQTSLFQLKDRNYKQSSKNHKSTSNYINYSHSSQNGVNQTKSKLILKNDIPPVLPHQNNYINQHFEENNDHLSINSEENQSDLIIPKRTNSKIVEIPNIRKTNDVQVLSTSKDVNNENILNSNLHDSLEDTNSTEGQSNLVHQNTLMSSSSNNSSSNNNSSLTTGCVNDDINRNNQCNHLDSCNSIDNLPPEYDQVYGDHYCHQSNQGNISPSNRSRISNQSYDTNYSTGTGKWKVSAKIQQLLNTLKRPKKRPLHDFYKDDDCELEVQSTDPTAPKPEGSTMVPNLGEQLKIPSGLSKTLEAALQRYGSATFKASAVTVLDTTGKISAPLTYGKLLSRSKKIAYNLLNKVGQKRSSSNSVDILIKTGDRVALVYPNNDPIGFMCAFYGCLTAGVVPVAVEVPMNKRDSGSQQIGFLLGSCNVNYAITSEACYKGLPKTPTGEIHTFKGWPRLNWLIPEQWNKPPKDWLPPPRISEDATAYIEYAMDKEGSMKGVCVSRNAMISHCRALTGACGYTEGDIMVCVLDFKREVGLWHSVLTSILNGIHVIFVPYSLMKLNPSSWMLMITKFKATTAICKSRDLHWGLLASKDHKDVNLSSLRMLLVADGANPWSLSSCDQFMNIFNSRGLKPDAVCPSASSTEAMTVSIRRPGRTGKGATGRGVLSMSALSHGVIRVDQENSLTSLTLQDCGHILPGSSAAVIKINGPPYRCKTDEVGELCVSSFAINCSYRGLQGLSKNQFRMEILNTDGSVYGNQVYVRSGLLGFMGPGGLVFICGTRDGLMQVSGRKHNTDDIIATVLAVEPMKFVYRGRIAVFSTKVLRDDRICVVAEQRPDCTEEESFQWMSRVLQAIDSIHQVGIYCLALVPPNYLPKTPLGGIHLPEVKRRFLEGTLHPANVLMCPHTCVTNLPKPRESHPEVGPASVMVGNIVQGNRLAVAQGRELGPAIDDPAMLLSDKDDFNVSKKCQYISEILKWRATTTADHNLFTLLSSKGSELTTLSCSQLNKKAERIACLLLDKGKLNTGDHVSLIYSPGIDLICAFYGCLYIGVVPVTIRPPCANNLQNTLPTVKMIVDVSKSVAILSTGNTLKLLKSKESANIIDFKTWVPILDTEDITKKKFTSIYRAPTPEMIAYLDFSISTTGMLAGIKMSHSSATTLCKSMKLACELYPSRHIALCLDPYSGLGFVLWCLSSIYSGHHSILIPPNEVENNPSLWLTTLSQYKVRDTFCSYGVMELCTKELGNNIQQFRSRGINLSCIRTCVVVAEERPRVALTNSFSKLFSSLGLSSRAVSTSFGCRVNVALCLQGASSPDPTTVYVDMRALRNDRVTLVERGAPHSLSLIESGKLLPGVRVIIANPDTKGHCGDCNLGEIWVQSSHNSSGYYTCYGDEQNNVHNDEHFNAKLTTGDTTINYARTGYLGFLRRTQSIQADGELHDAIYVVGSLDETIMLRGMRYHPIDIENSVLRCHKKVAECAIFTWTNLLVVVVELDGNENEALDLVPLVTNVVLEEHQVIVGVVVVVDPGVIPIDSRGEKQRMLLRDGFLADKLDPIYVAYNM